jgi:hypothetical protein
MSVKFTFGGVKRELRVELAMAPRFEDATGLGYLELTQALVERKAKLTQVVEVLRVAFEGNGTRLTSDDIFNQISHDETGILNAYVVAALLVMELCKRPEMSTKGKAPGKRSNSPAGVSH